MTSSGLKIPNRFESLAELFGNELRPLIVAIDEDLIAFNALRDRARVQNGGLLAFLLGPSGVGKTTAVHAAAVHMPSAFTPVVTVPLEISLRDAGPWLSQHVPPPEGDKTQIILFDGREISDDDVGIKQLLSTLNQFLRRRPDVLFFWPTTDEEWQKRVRGIAENVGGANFAPREADHVVIGPPAGEWPTVLDRLLLQFGKTPDVALPRDLIGTFSAEAKTVGDFLTKVGSVVADRVTKTRDTKRLPQLIFVVSSSGEVVGEANRIRRGGTQALAPEPLLGHSPRSEAGKWWTERNKNPNHHLGYIISLFDARLVTLTASAVVYSALHSEDEKLRETAAAQGARADKGNAKRTIEVSELFRFLKNEQIQEFTSVKRGRILDATEKAYAAIQATSAKRHKIINTAICRLVIEHLADQNLTAHAFEVSVGGDLITDAVFTYDKRPLSLEFHHLSEAQCGAANMASYIMDKLRTYAWYHQLIPR
jgi:hypothetical protein